MKLLSFVFLISISISVKPDHSTRLITHGSTVDIGGIEKRLRQADNLTLPLEVEIELLHAFNEFPLGEFLLKNKGLNGYWIDYVILGHKKSPHLHPEESWLLNKAPIPLSTQERFFIFQDELIKLLTKNDMELASIPCGSMMDLLHETVTNKLNEKGLKNITLTGIDLDEESLKLAKENSENYTHGEVKFAQFDAWNIGIDQQFDVILSNGLNIYEPDDKKVEALYKEFYKALKTGGVLITSFLTPPPSKDQPSTWKVANVNDLIKQKALIVDIIQGQWQSFRTEAITKTQLLNAGFSRMQFIYDSQGMYPTVVAYKE